jgi:hypothetical protein
MKSWFRACHYENAGKNLTVFAGPSKHDELAKSKTLSIRHCDFNSLQGLPAS